MFTELNVPQRMKVQGFYSSNDNQLSQLVVKAVRLLSSLVEANMEEDLILSMTNSIQCKFLIDHLTRGFLQFINSLSLNGTKLLSPGG